ncbi:HAD family hydrolase [Kineosporia babensis]|uniref:HAD family hydrolase n=1 Tax=Kineosporia babensis TaxID=499548 RepID=A0A9X1STX7_9ACTN|nr:hypothetical protein [Kineosporia babensis]MCD5311786.1 hypothetical protein [Kineosporia babensis]
MSRPVLIFDFDGTVALGHGPVFAYAAAVDEAAGLNGEMASKAAEMIAAGTDNGAIDAYDLVRMLAVEAGAGPEALDLGYKVSRAQLGTDQAAILAPIGLAAFLGQVDAERILITNAPEDRLAEAITLLGLDGCFDRVLSSGGKPDGLGRLIDELLAADQKRRILCIGDIWRNDLEPAHARGLDTALVGGWGSEKRPATYQAADVAELLPQIQAWVGQ